MPHIGMQREDIPNGVLQVIDLVPNNSTKNNILEPAEGQSRYVKQPQNDTVGTVNPAGSQLLTAGAYSGLAAYLLDNVEDQAAGASLTAAQANEAADNIITNLLRAGADAEAADVNAEIQAAAGVNGGTTLTAGDSTGDLTEVLQILAGRTYSVPSGAEIQDAGGDFQAARAGAFDADEAFVPLLATGELAVSVAGGYLSGFLSADFEYGGTAGAAVVVYNDDGSLYTV